MTTISLTDNKPPLKLELLLPGKKDLDRVGNVDSLSIFEANSRNFHAQGLFSTEIFGRVGEERRNRTFGYIDLGTPIIHPLIYETLIKLKSLYGEIMSGKAYAVWNIDTKDFERSNAVDGKTGMKFFLTHLSNVDFKKTSSTSRLHYIKLVKKHIEENDYLFRYLLVLPSGIRDYSIDPSGKPSEDEINKLYRKLIINSNLVISSVGLQSDYLDSIRHTLQSTTYEIYKYLKDMVEGKNKLILGKFMTRKTFNTTRNVFSSNVEQVSSVDSPSRLKYNETAVGLLQFLRSAVPMSIYYIRNQYLQNVFPSQLDTQANITNIKTMKKESVVLKDIQKDFDTWTNPEGILDLIVKFGNKNIRHDPVFFENEKYAMGLIYQDKKYFKFFQDIDELPEGYSKDNVRFITYMEILYLSIYKLHSKLPGFITRYPITGYGSVYPSYIHIKTTVPSLALEELDDNWMPSGDVAPHFPVLNKPFHDTLTPHPSHLARLGADFDGDTGSLQIVMADESIEEIEKLLGKAFYYKDPTGRAAFSASTDTLDTVLNYLTG